jgi:hypothetical protein
MPGWLCRLCGSKWQEDQYLCDRGSIWRVRWIDAARAWALQWLGQEPPAMNYDWSQGNNYNWYSDTTTRLQRIEHLLYNVLKQETKMAVDFTAINAEVARQTTVDASIETLLTQVAAALTAIPKSTDPVTQAALDAVVVGMKANNDAIVASVVANTPAA